MTALNIWGRGRVLAISPPGKIQALPMASQSTPQPITGTLLGLGLQPHLTLLLMWQKRWCFELYIEVLDCLISIPSAHLACTSSRLPEQHWQWQRFDSGCQVSLRVLVLRSGELSHSLSKRTWATTDWMCWGRQCQLWLADGKRTTAVEWLHFLSNNVRLQLKSTTWETLVCARHLLIELPL